MNHILLNNWNNKYVLTSIITCILQYNAYFDKREEYTINFKMIIIKKSIIIP